MLTLACPSGKSLKRREHVFLPFRTVLKILDKNPEGVKTVDKNRAVPHCTEKRLY